MHEAEYNLGLEVEPSVWVAYHVLIVLIIAIDLLRRNVLTFKDAIKWFILWVGVAVAFGIVVLYRFGLEPAAIYYASYVLQYTLSLDNLFVFAVIFAYFAVPEAAQPVVLYMGIIGVVITRAAFLFGGLWLLESFRWMVFVFGAVLIYTGIKLWNAEAERIEVERNPVVRWARRFLPITDRYHGSKFIVRGSRKLMFTPLIVVLLSIESTDLMFSFDSVPATIALTRDFFLAYTSTLSGILGLRSLYFLIALTMHKFRFVSKGLAIIVSFFGVKFFLAEANINISTPASLTLIFGVLAISMLASLFLKPKATGPNP